MAAEMIINRTKPERLRGPAPLCSDRVRVSRDEALRTVQRRLKRVYFCFLSILMFFCKINFENVHIFVASYVS